MFLFALPQMSEDGVQCGVECYLNELYLTFVSGVTVCPTLFSCRCLKMVFSVVSTASTACWRSEGQQLYGKVYETNQSEVFQAAPAEDKPEEECDEDVKLDGSAAKGDGFAAKNGVTKGCKADLVGKKDAAKGFKLDGSSKKDSSKNCKVDSGKKDRLKSVDVKSKVASGSDSPMNRDSANKNSSSKKRRTRLISLDKDRKHKINKKSKRDILGHSSKRKRSPNADEDKSDGSVEINLRRRECKLGSNRL